MNGLSLAALTAATFAALHVGWSALASGFPGHKDRPSQLRGLTHWVAEGEVPLTEEGRVDAARTLAIGDSRAWSAVDRFVLDQSEFGPSAVLWGSGGDLRVLLREAIKIAPEILIVGLSPHSIGPAPNKLFIEVTRQPAPVFFPESASPAEVRAWRRAEALHLAGEGYPEALSAVLLQRLVDQFQREYELERRPTRRFEARLNAAFARRRFNSVYTLQTSRWRRSWLPINNPTTDAKAYRTKLGGDHFQSGKESFRATITGLLREASAVSKVIVVRFPLSPEVRAAEDENVSPDWLAEIAADAGLPYKDFGDVDGTADGSHLTTEASTTTTVEVIEELRRLMVR